MPVQDKHGVAEGQDGVELEFHPLANVFPLIEGREFDALVADVRAHGVREPVTLHKGAILDGRNRYRAAKAAGISCPTVFYDGDDPFAFIISRNMHRRHLSESQRAMVAASIATTGHGGHRRRDLPANLPLKITQAKAAEMLNVGERTVRNAAVVRDHGSPELQAKVTAGEMAVSAAAKIARPNTPATARPGNDDSDHARAIRLCHLYGRVIGVSDVLREALVEERKRHGSEAAYRRWLDHHEITDIAAAMGTLH